MDKDKKIAVVTGASSGIGKSTALVLANNGYRVLLISKNETRLKLVQSLITSEGGDSVAYPINLKEESSILNFITQIKDEYPKIDLLINCAGDMQPSSVMSSKFSDWDDMVALNLMALAKLTKVCLPLMVKHGGHIINITSTASYESHPNFSIYSASKKGVLAFSDSLRKEVQDKNIKVTCISPSTVSTNLIDNINDDDIRKKSEEYVKAVISLEPEDISNTILYVVGLNPRVQVNEIVLRPMPASNRVSES